MARNASGTYSLPAKNPVVTGTTIESDWANTTLADIAAALTDSLSRNGNGGMLVPLEMLDGEVGAPGITFTNEPTSGFYRAAAGDVRLSILGMDALTATATGLVAAGTFEAEGGLVITRPELPAVGQQKSSSSLLWSALGSSYSDISNLSVTITTSGRPVLVWISDVSTSDAASSGIQFIGSGSGEAYVKILRGATALQVTSYRTSDASVGPQFGLPGLLLDVPAAGTYTYKAQGRLASGTAALRVGFCTLNAFEL